MLNPTGISRPCRWERYFGAALQALGDWNPCPLVKSVIVPRLVQIDCVVPHRLIRHVPITTYLCAVILFLSPIFPGFVWVSSCCFTANFQLLRLTYYYLIVYWLRIIQLFRFIDVFSVSLRRTAVKKSDRMISFKVDTQQIVTRQNQDARSIRS